MGRRRKCKNKECKHDIKYCLDMWLHFNNESGASKNCLVEGCGCLDPVLDLKKIIERCPMCKGKGVLKMYKGTLEELKKQVGLG